MFIKKKIKIHDFWELGTFCMSWGGCDSEQSYKCEELQSIKI